MPWGDPPTEPLAMRPVNATLAIALLAVAALAAAPPLSAQGERVTPGDLVGRPLPDIRARPVAGAAPVSLAELEGRPVLLMFFATWCHGCRAIGRQLVELGRAHDELAVLALSHEPRPRLQRHLEAHPLGVPVAQCTGRTAVSYGAFSVPTLVLAGPDHVVRHAGVGAGALPALRQSVRRLLAER